MRVSHEHTAVFDDPNLVSCAGSKRAGLPSWGRWRNGALPEPPGGLSFDGLAVWSAVF